MAAFSARSGEFLDAFLAASANEKDPRNLLLIFTAVPLLVKLPLKDHAEELFESVFCYFPVTFRSNTSDPALVTVGDLKAALRRAIASGRAFGDLAVPLLIEKMASTLGSAKTDALDVLVEAIPVYDTESFAQFQFQLEVAIFAEITGNPDAAIQQSALCVVRLMAARLTAHDSARGQSWMDKFLRESVSAVELQSPQVLSRAAAMIEAVASADESCFQFALDACLDRLLLLGREKTGIRGQAARNSLVALLSPLRAHADWKHRARKHAPMLDAFFEETDGGAEEYGVHLVMFSFVGDILGGRPAASFVARFVAQLQALSMLSVELKNCIWLASKSHPDVFSIHIESDVQPSFLTAFASTAQLTLECLKRLVASGDVATVEEVLLQSDLSLAVQDRQLVATVCSQPVSEEAYIRLVSTGVADIQMECIMSDRIALAIVASRPEAIQACDAVIMERLESLTPVSVASLFNKCPSLWTDRLPLIQHRIPHYLAALRGLLLRCDKTALERLLLVAESPAMTASLASGLFDTRTLALVSSSTTFHVRRPLFLQWLLASLIPRCAGSSPPLLALLVSTLSCTPVSVTMQHAETLPTLVFEFLAVTANVDVEIRKHAWMTMTSLLEAGRFDDAFVAQLVALCLRHCRRDQEPSSLIRHWALRLLSRLVELKTLRAHCHRHQTAVLHELKIYSLDDPKRVVRQEAAKCRNLWHVMEEDIF